MKSILFACVVITLITCAVPLSLRAQILLPQGFNGLSYDIPELLFPVDARSAALGQTGLTKDNDAFAAFWNPAKYVFNEQKLNIGVNYTSTPTPYNSGDFFGNFVSAFQINDKNAIAISADYYNLGRPNYIPNVSQFEALKSYTFIPGVYYAHKMNENFSIGAGIKYYYARMPNYFDEVTPNSVIFSSQGITGNLSFFYTKEMKFLHENAALSLGANIANLGGKSVYENWSVKEPEFLPADLGLGSSLAIDLNEKNSLSFYLDLHKLLIPTPDTTDENHNYKYDYIEKNPFQGIFTSFADAPGGAKEEFQEINWRMGLEYWYDKTVALRLGYYDVAPEKGDVKFITVGAGMRNNFAQLDAALLFPGNKYIAIAEYDHPSIMISMTCNLNPGKKDSM